jgi:hypothetical protein
MPAKPKNNWNDVQTAIATATIVTTLGMWNLFATPAKAQEVETLPEEKKPILPAQPLTEPPVGYPVNTRPYVKIMFTQVAPQTTTNVQQPQQRKKKKKDKNNGGDSGGGGSAAAPVTQTQSS